MFKLSLIIAIVVIGSYVLRRRFHRMFYILWTGDEHPDWEAIYLRWYKDKSLELLIKDGGKPKPFAKEAAEK